MTLRVLVVDDEPLARERIRELLRACDGIEVVGECADGESAVAAIEAHSPDLVFLDIQMPALNGFDVLEALGAGRLPGIIFITAFDEYAVRAFETGALDYLLKPVTAERFQAALERASARLVRRGADDDATLRALLDRLRADRGHATRFVARDGARITFVNVADVDWIDASGNYARLHAGSRTHLLRETLKSLESRLDPAEFVRVHRSAIVRLERIVSLEPYFHGEYIVTLQDGTKLTASRSYSARLRALLR